MLQGWGSLRCMVWLEDHRNFPFQNGLAQRHKFFFVLRGCSDRGVTSNIIIFQVQQLLNHIQTFRINFKKEKKYRLQYMSRGSCLLAR